MISIKNFDKLLGLEIRLFREVNGLSIRKLAKMTNISSMYLCEIESNMKIPTRKDSKIFKKLAPIMKMKQSELLHLAETTKLFKDIRDYEKKWGIKIIE